MEERFFITTFFVCNSINIQGCPPYVFGPDCNQRCHCIPGHSCDDGVCPCNKGWFGYKCQLMDLLYADPNINVTYNGVRRSHLEPYTGKGPIIVTYPTLEHFTSLAIVLEENEDMKAVSLSYVDKSNTTTFCEHMQTISPNATFRYLRCDTYCIAKQIVFNWDGVWRLKFFFVSGGFVPGQDFGFKSLVVGNGGEEAYKENITAVSDCDRSTCVTANQTRDSSYAVKMQLSSPQLVQKVIVILGSNDVSRIILNLFYVLGDRQYYLTRLDSTSQIHHFSLTRKLDFVSELSLVRMIEPTEDEVTLRVCDILVLGDCPSNAFGPTCSSICFAGCVNRTCDYVGDCYKCIEGWNGSKCDQTRLRREQSAKHSKPSLTIIVEENKGRQSITCKCTNETSPEGSMYSIESRPSVEATDRANGNFARPWDETESTFII